MVQALEAVVDLGPLQRDHAHRRHVTDEERRPAAGLDLGDRAHRHAVAVGELQRPVDPALRLRRQLPRRQLARRQHDLPQLAVHPVAVGVDGPEVVVEAEELDLIVALEQRALVPEPDVAERPAVVGDRLRFDGAARRMAARL